MGSIIGKKRIGKWIAVYLGAVSCIFIPLYMRHGYFSLGYWKVRVYQYAVIPALTVMAATAGIALIRTLVHNDGKGQNRELFIKKVPVSAVLLAAIAAWALISSALSISPGLSLMGTAGWFLGSLMTALLVMSTIIISQYFDLKPYMLYAVMAVNVFINAFAIIQSAGVDLFGLLKKINGKQVYAYLSTIGQKNSYSGYLCLVLPFFWGAFMTCRDRLTELMYGVFAAFGFMGIIMAESDSIYAGIGICVLFMLPYIFCAEQHVKRSSILLILYGVCLLIVRYLPVFSGKVFLFKGISKAMIGRPIAEIICAAGVILYFLGWKFIGGKWGKHVLIAIELGLLAGIGWYAADTAIHFNDGWGTGRGLIWRVGWERFLEFPLHNKLTGIGPEMLVTVYTQIRDTAGKNVVSAHCEPLQVLLTQGIAGLGLYLAYWGYLLKLYLGNKLWKKSTAPFFFPLAAYWGQSIFCSAYPVTAIVFSFVSGMYIRATETRNQKGAENGTRL